MIALLRVEFLRLRSRRLFRWLTLLAVAGFLVAGVIVFFTSDDSGEARAVAGIETENLIEECVRQIESGGDQGFGPPEATEDPEGFCTRSFAAVDPGFNFIELHDIALGLAVPTLALAWLLGASAMGAEWPNRTMTSLLTWEPRRTRVFVAKFLAATISGALWVFFFLLVLTGVFALVTLLKGSFDGADSEWLADYARRILVVAGGGAIGSAFGFCLATIGRNTAAALGAGFAYLAIVESLIRGFKPSWSDWLVGDNLGLYLAGASDVNHLGHSQAAAGSLLVFYALVLAVAALVTFRTREVA